MDYVILAEWLADDNEENQEAKEQEKDSLTALSVRDDESDMEFDDENVTNSKWEIYLRNQPVVLLTKLEEGEIRKWQSCKSTLHNTQGQDHIMSEHVDSKTLFYMESPENVKHDKDLHHSAQNKYKVSSHERLNRPVHRVGFNMNRKKYNEKIGEKQSVIKSTSIHTKSGIEKPGRDRIKMTSSDQQHAIKAHESNEIAASRHSYRHRQETYKAKQFWGSRFHADKIQEKNKTMNINIYQQKDQSCTHSDRDGTCKCNKHQEANSHDGVVKTISNTDLSDKIKVTKSNIVHEKRTHSSGKSEDKTVRKEHHERRYYSSKTDTNERKDNMAQSSGKMDTQGQSDSTDRAIHLTHTDNASRKENAGKFGDDNREISEGYISSVNAKNMNDKSKHSSSSSSAYMSKETRQQRCQSSCNDNYSDILDIHRSSSKRKRNYRSTDDKDRNDRSDKARHARSDKDMCAKSKKDKERQDVKSSSMDRHRYSEKQSNMSKTMQSGASRRHRARNEPDSRVKAWETTTNTMHNNTAGKNDEASDTLSGDSSNHEAQSKYAEHKDKQIDSVYDKAEVCQADTDMTQYHLTTDEGNSKADYGINSNRSSPVVVADTIEDEVLNASDGFFQNGNAHAEVGDDIVACEVDVTTYDTDDENANDPNVVPEPMCMIECETGDNVIESTDIVETSKVADDSEMIEFKEVVKETVEMLQGGEDEEVVVPIGLVEVSQVAEMHEVTETQEIHITQFMTKDSDTPLNIKQRETIMLEAQAQGCVADSDSVDIDTDAMESTELDDYNDYVIVNENGDVIEDSRSEGTTREKQVQECVTASDPVDTDTDIMESTELNGSIDYVIVNENGDVIEDSRSEGTTREKQTVVILKEDSETDAADKEDEGEVILLEASETDGADKEDAREVILLEASETDGADKEDAREVILLEASETDAADKEVAGKVDNVILYTQDKATDIHAQTTDENSDQVKDNSNQITEENINQVTRENADQILKNKMVTKETFDQITNKISNKTSEEISNPDTKEYHKQITDHDSPITTEKDNLVLNQVSNDIAIENAEWNHNQSIEDHPSHVMKGDHRSCTKNHIEENLNKFIKHSQNVCRAHVYGDDDLGETEEKDSNNVQVEIKSNTVEISDQHDNHRMVKHRESGKENLNDETRLTKETGDEKKAEDQVIENVHKTYTSDDELLSHTNVKQLENTRHKSHDMQEVPRRVSYDHATKYTNRREVMQHVKDDNIPVDLSMHGARHIEESVDNNTKDHKGHIEQSISDTVVDSNVICHDQQGHDNTVCIDSDLNVDLDSTRFVKMSAVREVSDKPGKQQSQSDSEIQNSENSAVEEDNMSDVEGTETMEVGDAVDESFKGIGTTSKTDFSQEADTLLDTQDSGKQQNSIVKANGHINNDYTDMSVSENDNVDDPSFTSISENDNVDDPSVKPVNENDNIDDPPVTSVSGNDNVDPSIKPVNENDNIGDPSVTSISENDNVDDLSVNPVNENDNIDYPSAMSVNKNDNVDDHSVTSISENDNVDYPSVKPVPENDNVDDPSVKPVHENDNVDDPSVTSISENENVGDPSVKPVHENENVDDPSVKPVNENDNADDPSVKPVNENNNVDEPSRKPCSQKGKVDNSPIKLGSEKDNYKTVNEENKVDDLLVKPTSDKDNVNSSPVEHDSDNGSVNYSPVNSVSEKGHVDRVQTGITSNDVHIHSQVEIDKDVSHVSTKHPGEITLETVNIISESRSNIADDKSDDKVSQVGNDNIKDDKLLQSTNNKACEIESSPEDSILVEDEAESPDVDVNMDDDHHLGDTGDEIEDDSLKKECTTMDDITSHVHTASNEYDAVNDAPPCVDKLELGSQDKGDDNTVNISDTDDSPPTTQRLDTDTHSWVSENQSESEDTVRRGFFVVQDKIFFPDSDDEDVLVDVMTVDTDDVYSLEKQKLLNLPSDPVHHDTDRESDKETDQNDISDPKGESSATESRADLSPTQVLAPNIETMDDDKYNLDKAVRPKRKRKRKDWGSEMRGDKMTTRKKQIMWKFCRCCYEVIEYPNMIRKKPRKGEDFLHEMDHFGDGNHRPIHLDMKRHSKPSPFTVPRPKLPECFVKLCKIKRNDLFITKSKHRKHKEKSKTRKSKSVTKLYPFSPRPGFGNAKTYSSSMKTRLDTTISESCIKKASSGITKSHSSINKTGSGFGKSDSSIKKKGSKTTKLNSIMKKVGSNTAMSDSSIKKTGMSNTIISDSINMKTGLDTTSKVSDNAKAKVEKGLATTWKVSDNATAKVEKGLDTTWKVSDNAKDKVGVAKCASKNSQTDSDTPQTVTHVTKQVSSMSAPVKPNIMSHKTNGGCYVKLCNMNLQGKVAINLKNTKLNVCMCNIRHKTKHHQIDYSRHMSSNKPQTSPHGTCYMTPPSSPNSVDTPKMQNRTMFYKAMKARKAKGHSGVGLITTEALSRLPVKQQFVPKAAHVGGIFNTFAAGSSHLAILSKQDAHKFSDAPTQAKQVCKLKHKQDKLPIYDPRRAEQEIELGKLTQKAVIPVKTPQIVSSADQNMRKSIKVLQPVNNSGQDHDVDRNVYKEQTVMVNPVHVSVEKQNAPNMVSKDIVSMDQAEQQSSVQPHSAPSSRGNVTSQSVVKQPLLVPISSASSTVDTPTKVIVLSDKHAVTYYGSPIHIADNAHKKQKHKADQINQLSSSHEPSTCLKVSYETSADKSEYTLFDDFEMAPMKRPKGSRPSQSHIIIKPPMIHPTHFSSATEITPTSKFDAFEDTQINKSERKIKFFDESGMVRTSPAQKVIYFDEYGRMHTPNSSPQNNGFERVVKPNLSQFMNPERQNCHTFGGSTFDMSDLRLSLEASEKRKGPFIAKLTPTASSTHVPHSVFRKTSSEMKSFADLKTTNSSKSTTPHAKEVNYIEERHEKRKMKINRKYYDFYMNTENDDNKKEGDIFCETSDNDTPKINKTTPNATYDVLQSCEVRLSRSSVPLKMRMLSATKPVHDVAATAKKHASPARNTVNSDKRSVSSNRNIVTPQRRVSPDGRIVSPNHTVSFPEATIFSPQEKTVFHSQNMVSALRVSALSNLKQKTSQKRAFSPASKPAPACKKGINRPSKDASLSCNMTSEIPKVTSVITKVASPTSKVISSNPTVVSDTPQMIIPSHPETSPSTMARSPTRTVRHPVKRKHCTDMTTPLSTPLVSTVKKVTEPAKRAARDRERNLSKERDTSENRVEASIRESLSVERDRERSQLNESDDDEHFSSHTPLVSPSNTEIHKWNRVSVLGDRVRYLKEIMMRQEQEIAQWKKDRGAKSQYAEGEGEEISGEAV